jgi:hypothetical protein
MRELLCHVSVSIGMDQSEANSLSIANGELLYRSYRF